MRDAVGADRYLLQARLFCGIDLNLADGNTGAAAAQTLQSLGIRVIILSGHSNVGAGLGCVPHTFAAKPVSREVVTQLLGPARPSSAAQP